MVLEYDINTNVLAVTITHETPSPSLHYIEKIEVYKNNDLVISEDYESQPNQDTYTKNFDIVAEIDDELKVIAYCNIQGSITRTITVEDPLADNPPVVQIKNPTAGYFHFSGIRLFPTPLDFIADTMGFGGFRLRPLQIFTSDDNDEKSDIKVSVFINEEKLGDAEYNPDSDYHEIKWTGPALGKFDLKAIAEDTAQNTNEISMEVWYFCFIP
jgi:desulfoferrodoxin (superoxide reductase-like protein)